MLLNPSNDRFKLHSSTSFLKAFSSAQSFLNRSKYELSSSTTDFSSIFYSIAITLQSCMWILNLIKRCTLLYTAVKVNSKVFFFSFFCQSEIKTIDCARNSNFESTKSQDSTDSILIGCALDGSFFHWSTVVHWRCSVIWHSVLTWSNY